MDSYPKARAVRSGPPEVVLEEKEEDGEGLKKELALDDILEILARLPVESLLRFKCVSKLWYSLIMSPNLIAMHYTHSHRKDKVPLLFLLSSEQYANPSDALKSRHAYERSLLFELGDLTKSLPLCGHLDHVEIVGCLFGVFCLSISRHPQLYVLWNPATGKVREIGDAPMEGPASTEMAAFIKNGSWYGSGFCFDPVTNAFKIAQFRLTVTEAGETRAQVNVFSTVTNSWTEKNIHVPCCIRASGSDGLTLKIRKVATCVNGYMHMLVALFQDNMTLQDMYILRYDMTGEVFQRIEMPFPLATDYDHIAPYQGCLALIVHKRTGSYAMDSSYNEVDVWVLNDCGGSNQSWSKIMTCKPSIKVKVAAGFFRKDNVDSILLCEEPSSSLYLYDPEKGETKKCSSEEARPHTFLYSESLASLN